MNTLKATTRQRLALSAALLAPALVLTGCNTDSDVEAAGVGMDTTQVVSGSGGAFVTDDVAEPAAEDIASGTDAGWEDVTVVPASSVGMETPLKAYEAFLVSVASWDNAGACSLITENFVAEMAGETQQEYVALEGVATDGTAGCVQSLDATLAWFDLTDVRDQGKVYEVVGVDEDFQSRLDHATDTHNSVRLSPSDLDFAGGYDATREIGSVDLSYTDGIGWQVAGLA